MLPLPDNIEWYYRSYSCIFLWAVVYLILIDVFVFTFVVVILNIFVLSWVVDDFVAVVMHLSSMFGSAIHNFAALCGIFR